MSRPRPCRRHRAMAWRKSGRACSWCGALSSLGEDGRGDDGSSRERRDNSARSAARRIHYRNPPPCSPGTTVIAARCRGALASGERGRSIPRVALRSHAAADDGQDRRALLRPLPGALARRARAGGGAARRGAENLGRARLLRPRPQPARLRQRRGRAAWRRIPGERSGAARASRHRLLYRRGHRRDCLRRAGNPGRRQRRTRHCAALCRGSAAAGRQVGDFPARARPHPAAPRRRFRASRDGPRRDHLHAEEASLHSVPLERMLRRVRARRRGGVSAPAAETRRRTAPRCRFRRAQGGRLRAGADAAGKGPARRHDRSADDGVGARFR